MPTITLTETPSLVRLLASAIFPKKNRGIQDELPSLSIKQYGIKVSELPLKNYNNVCGFRTKDTLPATYPHILAFPLHLSLLSHPSVPFPLLGLVHLKNQIQQLRPLSRYEIFDIFCQFSEPRAHPSGTEFDIVTQVLSAGQLAWKETCTFLSRHKSKAKDQHRSHQLHSAPALLTHSEHWHLNSNLGRRYARVSGDYNLIHIHPTTARLFGFRRALIHGMWTKARLLASLDPDLQISHLLIKVTFKLPAYIPSTLCFNWQQEKDNIRFQVLDELCIKPHLKGEIFTSF